MKEIIICTLIAALLGSCIFVRVVKPTEQDAPCCEEEE